MLQIAARPRQFLRIEREWTEGDTIELALPMRIALRKWQQNGDSVSVDRGPLTYSLKIGEKHVRAGGTDKWPAWEIHPTTPWNYGLIVDATAAGQVVSGHPAGVARVRHALHAGRRADRTQRPG